MALFCASVLTYPNVRSAPMLEDHHFRRGLTNFQTSTKLNRYLAAHFHHAIVWNVEEVRGVCS